MATDLRSYPPGLKLVTAALALSPLAHGAAWLAGVRVLNFGSRSAWDAFVYLAVAPLVAVLLARGHERARFSSYVFFTMEIVRGHRVGSWPLMALAAAVILYFQTSAVRRVLPRIDPRRVAARLRSLVHRGRGGGGPASGEADPPPMP